MKYLTAKEVAAELREHPRTTLARLRSGALPGHKVGRQWLVDAADLESFVNRHRYIAPASNRRKRRSA